MSKEIDDAVDALLTEKFVEVIVTYAGQTKLDDWDCDAWRVTIKAPGIPIKKMETEYHTGLGHRGPPARLFGQKPARPGTIAHEQWQATRKPIKPRAAGILYSLIRDAGALVESFPNWCADFGYSDDSIKAFNTYQACCKIGQDLNATLPREVINQLNVLLEDY